MARDQLGGSPDEYGAGAVLSVAGKTGDITLTTSDVAGLVTTLAGKQPLDADLTALGGLTSAANKVPYFTGSATAGVLDLSTNTALGTSDTTLSSQKAVKAYADQFAPWLVEFDPTLGGYADSLGNWVIQHDTGQNRSGYIQRSTKNDLDYMAWDVALSVGTWKVLILTVTSSAYGKWDLLLDAVSQGLIDCYSASPVFNVVKSWTGITVAASGKHRVTFKINGKNGSSSGFDGVLTTVQLVRTA